MGRELALLISLAFVMFILSTGESRVYSQGMRIPAVSGMFYPDSPEELRMTVDDLLSKADERRIEGELIALIAPHAGYMYSGPVAAYAYKVLEGLKFDTVILVGPSHYTLFDGISVYKRGYYQTPLGSIGINSSLAEHLIENDDKISFRPSAHIREHSLEVQLPFLQRTLEDFQIVPILMGDQSEELCEILSKALVETIGDEKVLLIASTDLSHYHSYEEAKELDKVALDSIEKLDPKVLNDNVKAGRCELCGAGPVIAVISAVKELGADRIEILRYANSGDITGEKGLVVGYGAVVIYRSPAQN
jgi:AmmeMemoRadiSam system protein B